MYGFSPNARSAASVLRACASAGCVGSRWERRTHGLMREITAITAIHTDIRDAVTAAVVTLADAHRSNTILDSATIACVEHALDGLQRVGGFELRCWAMDLREELSHARGRTLDQFLAPPLAPSLGVTARDGNREPVSV